MVAIITSDSPLEYTFTKEDLIEAYISWATEQKERREDFKTYDEVEEMTPEEIGEENSKTLLYYLGITKE